MTTTDRFRQYGEPLFDLVSRSPVVVTDPTTPRVGDLDDRTCRLVVENFANGQFAVTDESETVEVAFLRPDSASTKGYVYPVERLGRPDVAEVTDGLTPTELAKASFLRDLVAETMHPGADGPGAGEVLRLAERAGISERVIEAVDSLPLVDGDE